MVAPIYFVQIKILEVTIMYVVPIIKVVKGCNLKCIYCYYREKIYNQPQIMSYDILNQVIEKSLRELGNNLMFIWHGGEPLIAGVPFYQNVLSLEKQHVKSDQKMLNCIQTNGTLINDEWANFLSSNKFSVGISCDGPEHYHNSNRMSLHGNCFSLVYKGILQLQKFKTTTHMIAVITKQSLCGVKDIFEFFYKNNLPFHLKPCYELKRTTNTPTEFSITPEEYTDFMIEIFNLWWEKDNPNFKIRNLFNIMVGLRGGKPTLCENSGSCHSFLTIEPNGNVKPCDSFPQEKYIFGNILEQSWVEILNGSEYKNFLTDISESRKFCVDCKWSSICKGGCLRYSFDFSNDKWGNKNIFCESKKRLFEHISNKLK